MTTDPVSVQLWRSGPLVCFVVHHWDDAQRYEIKILNVDEIVDRRSFSASEDATAFALERLRTLSGDVGSVITNPIDDQLDAQRERVKAEQERLRSRDDIESVKNATVRR